MVEAGKGWGEVAVAIRIVRNSASAHMANRLREVYREYLEKYAQAVEQVGLPWLSFYTNLLCAMFLNAFAGLHSQLFSHLPHCKVARGVITVPLLFAGLTVLRVLG